MNAHEVGHDVFQGPLPFTQGAGAGAGVGPELANIFVLSFVCVEEGYGTPRGGIFARKLDCGGHFLHGKITNVTCTKADDIAQLL